jgi:hypothetical protein
MTIISVVLLAEIIASHEDNAYKHAEVVAARLKLKLVTDTIIIHEAIGRCLDLCRLYSRQNPSYQDKRQALLQRAYQDMLSGYKPNFKLATEDAGQDDSNVILRVGLTRLLKYCYAVPDRLTDNYTCLGQLRNRLLVEQEIFERSALNETDSLKWGSRAIKTLRALQDD